MDPSAVTPPPPDGFTLDAPQASGPPPPPEGFQLDQAQPPPPPEGFTLDQPEQSSSIGAGIRSFARTLIPNTLGAVAGVATAAGLAPEVSPFVSVPAGFAAAGATTYAAQRVQDELTDKLGITSEDQRQADTAQHPTATTVGELATALPTFGFGAEAALAKRALSGGIVGSANLVQQGITKGPENIDPTEALTAAGVGAALPNVRPWAQGAAGRVTEAVQSGLGRGWGGGSPPGGAAVNPSAEAVNPPLRATERQDAAVSPPTTSPAAGVAPVHAPAPDSDTTAPPGTTDAVAKPGEGMTSVRSDRDYPKGPKPAEGGVQLQPSTPLETLNPAQGGMTDSMAAAIRGQQGEGPNAQINEKAPPQPPPPAPPPEQNPQAAQPAPQAPEPAPAPVEPPAVENPLYRSSPETQARTDELARTTAAKADTDEQSFKDRMAQILANRREAEAAAAKPAPKIPDDLSIPDFLDRTGKTPEPGTETDEEFDKRIQDQMSAQPRLGPGEPEPQAMARQTGRGRGTGGQNPTQGAPRNLAQATQAIEDAIGSKIKEQPELAQKAIDAADEKYGRVPLRTRNALGDWWAKTWPMKLINPTGIDQSALVAEHDITANRFYREQNQFDAAMGSKAEDAVGALKPEQQRQIQYFLDGNSNVTKIKSMPDPQIERALRSMRDTTKMDETRIRNNDTVDFDNFNKNWWTQQFKDPIAAEKYRDQWQEADPSRAGKNPPLMDAHANKLELANDNPVNAFRSRREALFKMDALNRIIQVGKDRGLIQDKPFEGADKLAAPGLAGRTLYAPEGYATVFNRAYTQGFRSSRAGRQFMDVAQPVVNWGTSALLSLSAFHPFTMLNEGFVNGVRQGLLHYDDPVVMAKKLGMSPANAVMNTLRGKQGMENWINPTKNPEISDIIDELKKVGANPVGRGGDPSVKFGIPKGLKSAIAEIKNIPSSLEANSSTFQKSMVIPKATFNTVNAALNAVTAPLFEHIIPNMKMGTFLENRSDWARANPNATPEMKLQATRKIWNDIENRFGIMNHDNIFWHQGVKDGLNLAMNSMSWTYGFGRNMMSGLSDLTFHPSRALQSSKDYNPNIGSVITLGITTALMSMAYQYMKTGKPPSSIYDLMAGQTGGKTSSGQPERAILPGFQKDVFGWLHDPLQEATNKLGVVPKTMIEMLTGKGWISTQKGPRYGPISDPSHPFVQQLKERAAHAAQNFIPIGIKQPFAPQAPGSNISTPERLTAIRGAPKYINPGGNLNEQKYKQREYKQSHPNR